MDMRIDFGIFVSLLCILTVTGYSTTEVTSTTPTPRRYCYQCADTEKGGDCQRNLKFMAKAAGRKEGIREITDGDKSIYDKDYVKDCTHYVNNTYCVIETFEYRGQVNAFMRDCSDGIHFSLTFDDPQRPLPDNQTYCDRKGDQGTFCVRLCKNNFCNGPFPSVGVSITSSFVLGLCAFLSLMIFIR